MKNLLTAASWYEDMKITVRQYVNQWSKDQRVFRDIKKFGESHFVISAKMETVHQLLTFGQTYGLLTKYYSFFIVDTNSHTLNLTQIVTTEAEVPKIFALSLLNPEGFRKSQGWKNVMVVDKVTRRISKPVRLEAALIYDGLNLLMSALKNQSEPEEEPMTVCESRARHHWGKKFLNELQKSSNQGLTGQFKFGPNAVREIPLLEIIFIQRTGIEKIGTWNHSRLTWINYPIQSERAVTERIFFATLKVATVISPPFVMFSPSGELQGFCIDLLEELSKIVPFKYETVLLSQPNYGYLNQDGLWTGLMREIMDSSVDLVVADFTVTQERSAYIDFSVPFMHFCLTSVVFLPSQKNGNDMLIFKPFTFELWLHILIAFLGVSLLVYVLCHISRDLKADLHGRPQSPLSIGDCAWFTLTCLTRRTPKRMPKCASVLFLMSVWRVFVFVIASVYTANLAALQIRIKLSPGIRKMEDLTRDTPYVFGCIVNGSTHHLLKYSKNYVHQNLWDMINGNKHSEQISNFDNALERLKKSNFVFIGESATIEYATSSNCGIQVLPITTNTEPSLSYGIGLPKGSPYSEHINRGILRLQETGKLEELRRKWWQVGAKKSCKYTEPQTNRLNSKLMEFIVLFVLLLSGIIISIFLAFLEYIWTFNGLPVIIKPMHGKGAPQTGADESVETLFTSQNA